MKLVVEAGLIKVPPRVMDQLRKQIAINFLWYASWRIKGYERRYTEAARDLRDLRFKLSNKLKIQIPHQKFNPNTSYPSTIEVDLRGMPSHYRQKGIPYSFEFWIVWELDNPPKSIRGSYASWNSVLNQMVLNAGANEDLLRWPMAKNHNKLSYLLSKFVSDVEHELTHAIQGWMLPPKESARNAGYEQGGVPYYTSLVEYDPHIKSSLFEWASKLNDLELSKDELGMPIEFDERAELYKYLGVIGDGTSTFFKILKDKNPKMWRKAIKKFLGEYNKRNFRNRFMMRLKKKAR
jgi:hypothetical protein